MPGNEVEVARFIFNNIGRLTLRHLGLVRSVGKPGHGKGEFIPFRTMSDVNTLSSDRASKKADIYINGEGVSIKQAGSSFAFNRLQRANLKDLFENFGLSNVAAILKRLDDEVYRFHTRDEASPNVMLRDRPWDDFFTKEDFQTTLELLMMKMSPNFGYSEHPAKLILEAPEYGITGTNIQVHTFSEYFTKYLPYFKVSIRRVWYGQDSDSEHGRSRALISKPGNKPWVFNTVSGTPRSGWRKDVPPSERKTAYFLMISKVS